MTEASVSTAANLEPAMGNLSGCQLDEPQLQLVQQILPAIFAEGWRLSTWQYIVLFFIGVVVYDQGNRYRSSRGSLVNHMV
jgi:hypothetical protein